MTAVVVCTLIETVVVVTVFVDASPAIVVGGPLPPVTIVVPPGPTTARNTIPEYEPDFVVGLNTPPTRAQLLVVTVLSRLTPSHCGLPEFWRL